LSCIFFSVRLLPPSSTLFPYTTLFRSWLSFRASVDRRCTLVWRFLFHRSVAGITDPGRGQRPRLQISERVGSPSVIPTEVEEWRDRKSTRLNSSHVSISYAVFCLKKKK